MIVVGMENATSEIHSAAVIHPDAKIGKNVIIVHSVLSYIKLGIKQSYPRDDTVNQVRTIGQDKY